MTLLPFFVIHIIISFNLILTSDLINQEGTYDKIEELKDEEIESSYITSSEDEVDQKIQHVQSVLFQISLNAEAIAKNYTEELKLDITKSLGAINDFSLKKISTSFKKSELNIVRSLIRFNEEMLRDMELLLLNKNNELQEEVYLIVTTTNKDIIAELNAESTKIIGSPAKIDLNVALTIFDNNFSKAISKALLLFTKVTQIERSYISKIIEEKKNLQLEAVVREIHAFEKNLYNQFFFLNVESVGVIKNIITANTFKFVTSLEGLFNRVIEQIMSTMIECEPSEY